MEKRKIKICHIIHTLEVGGAEILLLKVCKELKNRWPEKYEFVVIASYKDGPLRPEFEAAGIKVIAFNLKGKKLFLKSVWNIFKVLIKERPDVVHTHLLPPDKYGMIAALFAFVKNRVSTIHNMEPSLSWGERLAVLIVKWLAKRMIAVSEAVKNNVVTRYGYNEKKIEVIYPVLYKEIKEKKDRKISSPVRLVNIANLKEQKGQIYLIPAALEMKKVTPHFTIDIYGSCDNDYGKKVKELIIENKLEDTIFLRGYVKDPLNLLNDYHIMISLSLWEGLPLSIIEGLMSDIPMILSDIPSHREIMKDVKDFVFVKPDSPSDIAALFRKLITDKDYYKNISQQLYSQAEKFSAEKIIPKYDKFYCALIS
ncbi:MAG: glycosyltransferase family 4 protein [Chitinispirillaceae bacterium]|nr:glycosyltransferase family 4 protein [Chitinispirillaceae bacterium]